MDAGELDLNKPHLMTSFTDKWPCRSWTFRVLAALLGDKQFSCRVAPKSCVQIMETQCSHHDVTIKQFCDWLDGAADESNPLHNFTREENSCYVDYKYMKDMFEDHEEVFDEVQWRDFGLIGFDGYDSTIWLSSEGANTPGHQDTYGFNLISQIYGKKLWILFPPEDSKYLYPTRVPYEESSIFTGVNVRRPDLQSHPKCWLSHPVVVTLCAGQTLYVPRHWWHYVESLEPSISINVWVPLKDDIESRLSEAITRCLATSLMTSLDTSQDNSLLSAWLNPTESLAPTTMNLLLLKTALGQLLEDTTVGENSKTSIEEQQGDQRKQQEMKKSHDCELKSLQGVYCNDDRTTDGLSLGNRGANEGLQDSVVIDNDCSGDSERAKHPSMLSLFAKKMEGHKIINVDTPFQCESNTSVSIERRACLPTQQPPPKKCKLEPSAFKESVQACADVHCDQFITETLPSRIFSFNPCLFDFYLKFVDDLCKQIECRHCHGGSAVDVSITVNEGNRVVHEAHTAAESEAHTAAESSELNVRASNILQEGGSRSQRRSCTALSESVGFPGTQKVVEDKCRKTLLDLCNEQIDKDYMDSSNFEDSSLSKKRCSNMEENMALLGDKHEENSSTMGDNLDLLGDKHERNSSMMGDNLNLLGDKHEGNSSTMGDNLNLLGDKHEENSSTMGDNLDLLGDKHEGNSNSVSTFNGPFSQLNQQEVGETLLNCVLHPDVVKMISELFKEQCQGRLRQKLRLK